MYYPTDPINILKGVGERIEKNLKRENIKTIGDLINYFPFRYEDLSKITNTSNIEENIKVVLKGRFKKIKLFRTKYGKQMVRAIFTDNEGSIEILWFNTTYILNQIKDNKDYMLTGKVTRFGSKLNIVNPQIEVSGETTIHSGRIVPVYFNINFLSMKTLRKLMLEALENIEIEDFLENNELNNYLSLKEAYKCLHFPENIEQVEKARDRIALNEVIHIKLHSIKQKKLQQELSTNFKISKDFHKIFENKIPFKLTKDQKKSINTIVKQLKTNVPMNILLSGDVGSGKTIVAISASHTVVKNKGKVLYLAPTVVLAKQIYKEFKKYLGKTINIEIATAFEKPKTNKWDILIGTHALFNIPNISEKINFVIIDEQHKFGVKQRAKIIEAKNPPHVLTMTATPIPRSLALTYFDELELCQIKTKPKGRKKIITKVLSKKRKDDFLQWLKEELKKGVKAYYIVPFIKKSLIPNFENVKSIEEMEPILKKKLGENFITVLHGKMKDEEKNKILENFKSKKSGVLLSTQVVEVGIDIKDATIIAIESAERFGLASLHQLRGRVGRSKLKSFCFLIPSTNNFLNVKRLKHMEKENDGFKLALLDLEERGGGEFFGIRQSGEIDLKFVSFSNKKLIKTAAKIANTIYNDKEKLKKYSQNYFTRDFFNIKDN